MIQLDLSHILNWELKAGSHKFPGPAGGTCINEAAVVAAGFEYRKVHSYHDLPECFCPVLGAFAIAVNDSLSAAQRQSLLMPLVTRLAGSRDEEDWVQRARAEFIIAELDREIVGPAEKVLPRFMASLGRYDAFSLKLSDYGRDPAPSRQLEKVFAGLSVARSAVRYSRPADGLFNYAEGLSRLARILHDLHEVAYIDPLPLSSAFERPHSLHEDVASVRTRTLTAKDIWPAAAEALTRAFRIGTQAPAADTAQVVQRLETIKARAKERA